MRGQLEDARSAEALFRAGRFPAATAATLRALEDDPRDPGTLERLGRLALLENRAQDAVRYLEDSLDRRPSLRRRWPLSAGVLAHLAMAHYRLDRFPDASRRFAAASGPVPVGPFRALAALAGHLGMFGDAPPYRIEGPDVARLEFLVTDPLPVVELSVNGGPPALFLIDTGGAEIVLDAGFAADANAQIAGSLRGEYAGGRRASTGVGRVASVRAGAMRVAHVPIHTLDLSALPPFLGIDVKGVVGTRFLMHFVATIDYAGGALILRRDRRPDVIPPGARAIPCWLAEDHLILARGSLNDLPPTLFWVDTGLAGSGFLAREATLKAAGVAIDWSRARETPGGGGMATETDVVIDRLTLGDGDQSVTRHRVPGVAMAKVPSVFGGRAGFEVGGLISHAFFRHGALTLDFTAMRLIVEPGTAP